MRFFRRSVLGLLLIAMTVGLLVMAALVLRDAVEARLAADGLAEPARERVFTANLVRAEAAIVEPVLTVFGEVRSRRTLELRSPRAGTVVHLAEDFRDGARVAAGQLLLRLDPADAASARDIARSNVLTAEAEGREAARALILAQDDLAAARAQTQLRAQALARQEDLRTRGVGSDAAVETAALALSAADQAVLSRRSALAQAEARVDQAATTLDRLRITLAETERALRDTELFAEFDGVLDGVTMVQGRILSANEPLGELIDPDALEVAFRVSTAQYIRLIDEAGRLRALPLSVSLAVAGEEILAPGRLTRAGASVGEGQSGRLIYADIDAPGGFRPGDFVTLRIEEPPLADAIALPATALGSDGKVLVLAAEDRLAALPVTLLRRQDDLVIVRAEGLDGREVVAERSPLLGAGIKVRPVRVAPPGEESAAAAPELIELTPERRAALIALVEGNARMPAEAKARVLAQLAEDRVPARVVARLEARSGG